MKRLALLALLLSACGEAYAPELATTEPVDAATLDVAHVDAAPADPCAHPNCDAGGRVELSDGQVILCLCPKAGR